MKTAIKTLLLLAFAFASASAPAQDRYERKSISYINALWLATSEARSVKPEQVGFMLGEIKARIEMPRFDYNPLPEALLADFIKAANDRETLTMDDLARLMEEKVTPTITGILQGAMRERGGVLVSEEKRQTFLATKAKELGITLDEIEKVMNSAYIYLPVLTGYQREEGKQEGKFVCTLNGGIIWFHVNTTGDQPRVTLQVAKTTLSKGFGSDKFAYESAVKNFARNLEVATREIAEFKLGAPISEVDGRNISFKLGVKEGIKTDECFLVGEWVSDAAGNVKFTTNGWVRVGRVADNRSDQTAKSSAWAVKGGRWTPGMAVMEHPRLPIDIALKAGASHLKITEGRILVFAGDLKVTEEYDTYAPGFDIDAQYNLGGIAGLKQTFFLVGGSFAFPATLEFELGGLAPITATPPFVWGLHGGLHKKFYFGQMALSAEGKFGVKYLTVKQSFGDDLDFTIKNNSAGLQFGLGLEYAATPDFNIGLTAGYKAYAASDVWTIDVNGEAQALVVADFFPDIDHSGPAFGVYIHWTPPSLPFDPISMIRGAMGE